ncbi:MAG: tetratricopeptide repeat protein [Deltaproteobacteria bacterium]|nr:MAG: tetratricopeptide repeat protein [Deltaproteobacteria bacterium]
MSAERSTVGIVTGGLYTIVAGVLAMLPLTNLLGYEFSFGIGIVVALLSGGVAIFAPGKEEPLADAWRGVRCNLLLLLAPLAIGLLNALRVENCNVGEGIAFFLLLPGVTAIVGGVLGVMLRRMLPARRGWALAAYFGIVAFSLCWDLYLIVFHPPVFAYNLFLGYFPGPIYDEALGVTGVLIAFRGLSLVVAGWLLSLLLLWEGWRGSVVSLRTQRFARFGFMAASLLLAWAFLARGDLGFETTRGFLQRTLGGHVQTPHFEIYYDGGLPGEEIEGLARDHEFRYAQLSRFFAVELPPGERFTSYVYAGGDRKKRLIGAEGTMIGDPLNGELHLNFRRAPHPQLKHELAHLFSGRFGPPFLKVNRNVALVEGVAVAADWTGPRYTPHEWSAAMRRIGKAPPLDRLLAPTGFWRHASGKAYTLSGSFVRFLIERHGIETFKAFYGGDSFPESYGMPLEEAIAAWEAFLDLLPLSATLLDRARSRFSRRGIFEKRCAHEVARLKKAARHALREGDREKARRLYERVLSFVDRDAGALLALVRLSLEAGDLDRAEMLALEAAELPDPLNAAQGRYVLGEIAWRRGDFATAKGLFEELSARDLSDTLSRRVTTALALLTDAQLRDFVLPAVLREGRSALPRLIAAWEAASEERTRVLLACTIAERHSRDALLWEERCRQGLASDASLSPLVPSLFLTFGRKRFQRDDLAGAEEIFEALRHRPLPQGIRVTVEDWLERCRWVANHRSFL